MKARDRFSAFDVGFETVGKANGLCLYAVLPIVILP
jgi:hypothetical protein